MDPQTIPQQTVSGISGGGEISLYQFFISSPLFAEFKNLDGNDHRIFIAQFIGLSPPLRNYLSSTETAATILATALNYELTDNQVSKIAGTIRELVLGKIFIKDFPITISSKLGIDDIRAGQIVNTIISQSFGPIIEDIKRIQRSKFPDKIQQLQKEARPTGLTRPQAGRMGEARPEGAAQRPEDRPQQSPLRSVENVRPPQPTSRIPEDRPQQLPPRPQFKVPDLSGIQVPPSTPSDKAQHSLEAELEKPSGVIDLRNKPQG